MKTETKRRIKLALRRFALRWLRKLVDVADDRLHAAEVTLRNGIKHSTRRPDYLAKVGESTDSSNPRYAAVTDTVESHNGRRVECSKAGESFTEWEARRSGITPKVKSRRVHRRRNTSADFDFQIIRKREEFVQ